jgi:hypothetical protein
MTATRKFFKMARKKVQRVAGFTGKPSDNAILKNYPSLRVAVWRASASLSRLPIGAAIAFVPCLADCHAKTATQIYSIPERGV